DAELEEYIGQAYVDESERLHPRGRRDLARELGLGEAASWDGAAAPESAAAPEPAAGGADFAVSAAAPMPQADDPEAELTIFSATLTPPSQRRCSP
ncbi:MAG: hypothetical protein ACI38Z_09140, partial [Parafannyhessea sp.]|uniref:hypothetical protein n=1 Tax=Parafannyhessea sp. TaxID=2847324 RepID=UPI003F10DAC3